MKFGYEVKHDGVVYLPGEEVPLGVAMPVEEETTEESVEENTEETVDTEESVEENTQEKKRGRKKVGA